MIKSGNGVHVPDFFQRIVWKKDNTVKQRFYWLAAHSATEKGAELVVEIQGQDVVIEKQNGFNDVVIYLNDQMLDLDQPLRVIHSDEVLFEGKVNLSIQALYDTMKDREDPGMIFTARLGVLF